MRSIWNRTLVFDLNTLSYRDDRCNFLSPIRILLARLSSLTSTLFRIFVSCVQALLLPRIVVHEWSNKFIAGEKERGVEMFEQRRVSLKRSVRRSPSEFQLPTNPIWDSRNSQVWTSSRASRSSRKPARRTPMRSNDHLHRSLSRDRPASSANWPSE